VTRRQSLSAAVLGLVLTLLVGFALGRFVGRPATSPSPPAQQSGRKVLYWYDPMVPQQHFPAPGKSPMGMEMVPKYADAGGAGEVAEPGIKIDPAKIQSLGVRIATVQRGELNEGMQATGAIDFNLRDVAIVQAKAAGFVQRVYARAPGDVIGRGAPLADLLVPSWAGAQGEYLAVRRTGDPALIQAARQRLLLLGMPGALIAQVERSGRTANVVTVTTPTGGVIKTLSVRPGMAVSEGETLAEVSGLGTVWLNAAVPEALGGRVNPGDTVTATLAAYPGETFSGRVTAVLPEAQIESRTLQVRVELPNPRGRLRPGMFANVQLSAATRPALLAPSEAIIRTGKRSLVMLALPGGRYQPAEIRTGQSAGDQTEILAGLQDGERIVASGEFLIDSEASLAGVPARPMAAAGDEATAGPAANRAASAKLAETTGRIEMLSRDSITLSHQPVTSLGWPAMTMTFHLTDPNLANGLAKGDRVRFAFDQPPAGPTVRRISKDAAQ
jgi:Cu(I)/Ag(I) efflux system membrane fusion protein